MTAPGFTFFRDRALVLSLFDYVEEVAQQGDPVTWSEALTVFGTDSGRPVKTVENALYELVRFGALHRTGRPSTKGRPDTRALVATPLGSAWREGRVPGLPGEPDDPLESADQIHAFDVDPDLEDLLDDVSTTLGHEEPPT